MSKDLYIKKTFPEKQTVPQCYHCMLIVKLYGYILKRINIDSRVNQDIFHTDGSYNL